MRPVKALLSTCSFLLSALLLTAQAPTVQDCLGAIPICQPVYTENQVLPGGGNYPNEVNSSISCVDGEDYSIWYTFTVQESGQFGFVLTPNNSLDDYDWALFNITNAECGDIFNNSSLLVSCNAAGGTGTNPNACSGPTGATGASSYDIQGAGCGSFFPGLDNGFSPFNDLIPVTAGNTYVLMVSNWSASTSGYSIDFGISDVNIFDFEAALVDMFLQTDVGEVPASIIHLPYSVQYLAFGPSPELELPGGRRVDGAYVYVQQLEGGQWLHVDLTTAPDGAIERGPASFIVQQDLGYHLVFQMDSERRLADVVEEALQEEIGDTLAPDSHERDFAQAAIEARDQGLTLTSSRRQGGERRAERLRAGFPIFRNALNLVVNALCFLTAYPDEATAEWPSDAPPSLVKKADAGKSYKEKRRAESKLLPLGFTRINFCRLHRQGKQSTAAAAGPAQTHWRRGHWRNQPHGEGRRLRKLIWIMPVLVNADEDDHSQLGHVYSVSADSES